MYNCAAYSQVRPRAKLPALCLLNVISKNIHDPHARLFASFIIPVFLESFGLLDPSTRNKMDELVLVVTWRRAPPTRLLDERQPYVRRLAAA
ncbi:hypothetical protein CYLTODRAFT_361729 [Cylindrobasidium torrendii FP15055 ss-10]|uniref:Uncharacterized protein n=1 Tax=Cylindrobasidium torrendii FP15055 ss-10 TaxID=1314674 RepID=A0A0D7AWQ2_9AGAR|nr:hypothetical protein CYLTODRAFT_361729 [Cylindrobasidium torrendii FP15055 ss-10]